MARNTFLACKLIFYILSSVLQSENFFKMWMSPDDMEKKYDYQMKEKVVQEEEESWERLCTKLVSNNTPNTPVIGRFMFLRLFCMLYKKSLMKKVYRSSCILYSKHTFLRPFWMLDQKS